MCNAGGPASEGYIGGSAIWMPLKGKLGGVEGVEAGMKIIDVDLGVLKVRYLYMCCCAIVADPVGRPETVQDTSGE